MRKIIPGATLAAGLAAFSLTANAAEKTIDIKGYLQTMYSVPDDNNRTPANKRLTSSFSIKTARIVFSGKAGPDWSYTFMLDGIRQPAIMDAFLDFSREKVLPEPFAFKFRAGQFKVPFSAENLVPDADLETVNRAQAVDALAPGRDYGTKGRDTGASLQLTASPWGRKNLFDATIGGFNGEGANAADKNKHKGFAARAVLNPTGFLSLGGSYYDGNRFSTSTVADRLGADATLKFGGAYLQGEYILGRDGAVRKEGWYAQAGVFILPKVLQTVVKYDVYDPAVKKSNAASSAAEKKTAVTTLVVNWYFSEGLRLQTDYEWKYWTDGGILSNTFNTVLALKF